MQRKRRWTVTFVTALTVVCVVGCWGWVSAAKRQYALNRQLIAALMKNDTKQALALINQGADPNTRFNPPPVPALKHVLTHYLHRAPPPADDSPTAFLFVCGTRWFQMNDEGIEQVTVEEDLPLMRAMLLHGADMNATTSDKDTALMSAITFRDAAAVALLLEHGAKTNTRDTYGTTLLMYAVLKGDVEKVRILLAHGAAMNTQDNSGGTALHYAIQYNIYMDPLRLLLAHGANPNLPDKHGVTPLMLAQKMNRSDAVALLRVKR